MLIASLPYLPHFTRAARLPINPQRLRWRRSALHPEDAAQLDGALDLLQWRRQPRTRTDAEIDRRFRSLLQRTSNAALREFLDFRMGERSVVAALRRKQRGLGPPSEGEICGVGRWDVILRRRWDREDFGLAAFPWAGRARRLLAEGSALALEELLMDAIWARLSRIEESRPFGFEAVFAYAFKWDILDRWLSYDGRGATAVFKRLVEEAIGEQAPDRG
jgi:hypothetical protein